MRWVWVGQIPQVCRPGGDWVAVPVWVDSAAAWASLRVFVSVYVPVYVQVWVAVSGGVYAWLPVSVRAYGPVWDAVSFLFWLPVSVRLYVPVCAEVSVWEPVRVWVPVWAVV